MPPRTGGSPPPAPRSSWSPHTSALVVPQAGRCRAAVPCCRYRPRRIQRLPSTSLGPIGSAGDIEQERWTKGQVSRFERRLRTWQEAAQLREARPKRKVGGPSQRSSSSNQGCAKQGASQLMAVPNMRITCRGTQPSPPRGLDPLQGLKYLHSKHTAPRQVGSGPDIVTGWLMVKGPGGSTFHKEWHAMKWGLGACIPGRGRRRDKKSLDQPAGSGELVQLGVPSVLPSQRCVHVAVVSCRS